MFDEMFFKTSLPQHINKKVRLHAVHKSASVYVHLITGKEYAVVSIPETSTGWVMLEVFPPKGTSPRENSLEDINAGAPEFDFDLVAVAYNSISFVLVTLEEESTYMGFKFESTTIL